jgi:hypothetical protein
MSIVVVDPVYAVKGVAYIGFSISIALKSNLSHENVLLNFVVSICGEESLS